MKMKKLILGGLLSGALMISACGKQPETPEENTEIDLNAGAGDTMELNVSDSGNDGGEADTEEPEGDPEGKYRSELTNEWIDEELKDQRPIAVMVDNESTALPHFGLTQADIVYEMMNSTANGRVTRLMPIVKDWAQIEQFGSIRSARPTNFMVAAEYNAILIHDGGPFYINDYVAKNYTNNLSGGFARFSNGKASEFTEYVTYEEYYNPDKQASFPGLGDRIDQAGYSTDYNSFYRGVHFNFSDDPIDLGSQGSVVGTAKNVTNIDLGGAFTHNNSQLKYNESTGTYDYYEYGKQHLDAGNNDAPLTFENVILQKCTFTQLDSEGYLIYNVLQSTPEDGYLIQDGKMVEIQWVKTGEEYPTVYTYKQSGVQVLLNTGKTYIGIIPADSWNKITLD
jgi:hypothetical protein